ncbi:MAG: hypothetical protein ABR510_11580 [Trueperaceae bacterium]
MMLIAGASGVLVGLVQLATYFGGGLSDRSLARSGSAEKLVRAAMFVTGGLFLSFFSLANLIALGVAGN